MLKKTLGLLALLLFLGILSIGIVSPVSASDVQGPVFSIWYGKDQVFGRVGRPQQWVNILGNVSDPSGIASLSYSLNGGVEKPLSVGPDSIRLQKAGDFNVDLGYAELACGGNTLLLTARDSVGNAAQETVSVTYVCGQTWPLPYTADWSVAPNIQDAAQIVDGIWVKEGEAIRTEVIGYDRLVAIGDIDPSWTDYEVRVPVVVHAIDPFAPWGAIVGVILRWQGHVDWDGRQPRWGWYPIGAFTGFDFVPETNDYRLRIFGNAETTIAEDEGVQRFVPGGRYIFKSRVSTAGGFTNYAFKVWPDGTPEPSSWSHEGIGLSDGLTHGSLMLLSHYVDVSFGKVEITPGPFPPIPSGPSAIVNGGFETGTGPWVFYTNGVGTFATDVAGPGSARAAHISTSTAGTNVQLHQYGLVLEANTQYRLRFKGYSNTGHDVSISVQKHGSPYTSYGLSGRVFDLTGSWRSYMVEFTTRGFTGMVNDGRLMFWLAPYDAAGDHYYFDDVVLEKVVSTPVGPGIVTQPTNQTVPVGLAATFSVAATGTAPLSYQWQKNTVDIPGATSATYTTPATVLGDSGSTYRCVVSNIAGNATSNTAILTVSSASVAPVITNHPSNQTVPVGLAVTFSVAATGTAPLSYQWQKNTVDIAGATSATYTTPATVLGDSGSTYRCVVSNIAGNATSNTATLTVTPSTSVNIVTNAGFETGTIPWVFYTNGAGAFATDVAGPNSARAAHISITTQGTNVQLYQAGLALEANTRYRLSFKAYSNTGHDVSISVQKHGSPYTSYGLSGQVFDLTGSWQSYMVEFTTSGFTGTVNDGRLMFWLAPYDAAGDQYYFDDIVLEKVGTTCTAPSITTQPANATVTVGDTATFSVAATGTAPLSYQWQKNGVNISGATAAAYTTPGTVLSDNGAVFRCVVTNACGNATSNGATLTVTSGGTVNLIVNPGFETGTAPWVFYTNGAGTFANDAAGPNSARAAHISITTQGTNVQLYQAGLALEANMRYRLSFKAYSNTGHDVSISVQKHGSPYTSYGLSGQVFDLTGSWQSYMVEFTTSGFTGAVNDSRLMFWLAPYDAAGDQYYFDDVVLEKVTP